MFKNFISVFTKEDKLKHIVVCAIITAILNLFLPWCVAVLSTIGIGIAKELYDKYSGKGSPELNDFYADCIGILIGVI